MQLLDLSTWWKHVAAILKGWEFVAYMFRQSPVLSHDDATTSQQFKKEYNCTTQLHYTFNVEHIDVYACGRVKMDSSQTGSAPGLGRALTKSYNSRPLSLDVSVYEGQGSQSSGGYKDYYSTVPNPNCARNFIFDQSKLYLSQSPKDRDGSLSQAAHNYTDRQVNGIHCIVF